jgi:hypothetical protein
MKLSLVVFVASLLSAPAMAQEWDINGRITSESGSVMPWGPVGSDLVRSPGIEFADIDITRSLHHGYSATFSSLTYAADAPFPATGEIVIKNAKWGPARDYGHDWHRDTMKAPEIQASGMVTALTFLGCCLAVLMGKRRSGSPVTGYRSGLDFQRVGLVRVR